jgi:hypothetical protein
MSHHLAESDSKSEKDVQFVHGVYEADVGLPSDHADPDEVFGVADSKGPNYRSVSSYAEHC